MLIDGSWLSVRDGDLRALGLYSRHYSAMKVRARFTITPIGNRARFVGSGEHVVLLTERSDALFAWRLQRFRKDAQTGIECAVFRNEGGQRSSALVQEAVVLAWKRWPGQRLFTFVDPSKVRSPTRVGALAVTRQDEYPDLNEYREASFQHAESHYEAATDPERCDDDDCPHWPAWWQQKRVRQP